MPNNQSNDEMHFNPITCRKPKQSKSPTCGVPEDSGAKGDGCCIKVSASRWKTYLQRAKAYVCKNQKRILFYSLMALSILLPLLFLWQWCSCVFRPFFWLAEMILPACWLRSTDQRIAQALAQYRADGIGVPDYALESVGGSVLCSSATYYTTTGPLVSFFGIPLWYSSHTPREVIRPDVNVGRCWPMEGHKGYVKIQLRQPVVVKEVTLEHIPKELSPLDGDRSSAAKDFLVIGQEKDITSPEVILGKFTYDLGGLPIQNFKIYDPSCLERTMSSWTWCEANTRVFRVVTLKILNNNGNPDYTCIYRFRVHGEPFAKEKSSLDNLLESIEDCNK